MSRFYYHLALTPNEPPRLGKAESLTAYLFATYHVTERGGMPLDASTRLNAWRDGACRLPVLYNPRVIRGHRGSINAFSFAHCDTIRP
jgi:hypothetical protein